MNWPLTQPDEFFTEDHVDNLGPRTAASPSAGGSASPLRAPVPTAAVIPGLTAALQRDGYAHCFGAREGDVYGILLGTLRAKGPASVQASLRAMTSDLPEGLTLTHASWELIYHQIDEGYPGLQIVGWYGTHLGQGLEITEHEWFMHSSFFRDQGQIAVIVDPASGLEAVFRWDNGRLIEHCRQACAYDSWRVPASREDQSHRPEASQPAAVARPPGRINAPTLKLESYVYLLAIAVSLCVVVWELLLR